MSTNKIHIEETKNMDQSVEMANQPGQQIDTTEDVNVQQFASTEQNIAATIQDPSNLNNSKLSVVVTDKSVIGMIGDMGSSQGEDHEESEPDRDYSNADLDTIEYAHKVNNIESNQFRTSKDFVKAAMYSVPLNKLYEVIASCQYNETAMFCPVLVKVVDEKIFQVEDQHRFLLQVWSKHGEMVYERKLRQPISNWNISEDKFIFQESKDVPTIYVVRLFLDKPPYIFKFNLPDKITKGRQNTVYNPETERFEVPVEQPPTQSQIFAVPNGADSVEMSHLASDNEIHLLNDQDNEEAKLNDIAQMKAMGELQSQVFQSVKEDSEEEDENAQSVNSAAKVKMSQSVFSLVGDRCVQRAPDKMIDFLQGSILLAYRDTIIYCNVDPYGVEDPEKIQPSTVSTDSNFVEVDISEDKLSYLNLHHRYKIICIQEIGQGQSAIVIEDLEQRQIRFIRAYYPSEQERKMKMVQLGVMVARSNMSSSPLVKYRSVAKTDTKTGKGYQVAIVVRQNGRVEFYSDFMLVNEYFNTNVQCVDVETDFHQFYLKFATDCEDLVGKRFDQIKYELRTVRHFWRNRIGYNSSKFQKNPDKWNIVLHKRVSNFMKLYTSIINFSMYMLVAHRNMISVFDMTQNQEDADRKFTCTYEFDSGHIRLMELKKRSKEDRNRLQGARNVAAGQIQTDAEKAQQRKLSVFQQYQIVCVIGTHEVQCVRMNASGEISNKTKKIKPPGRVLRVENDFVCNTGMLFLTDDSVSSMGYRKIDSHSIYTFPHEPNKDAVIKLYNFKQGTFYKLLDSNTSDCVAYDSFFKIARANRAVFEKHKDQFTLNEVGEEDDAVKAAFAEKNYVNVLICTSDLKRTSMMFTLLKERDPITQYITNMSLIMDEGNYKTVEVDQVDSNDPPIHSFYINTDELAEHRDSYVQVSAKKIQVYNKEMEIRLTFDGLNIRSCHDVHQGYLYTISNSLKRPYTITDDEHDSDPQKPVNFKFSGSGFYVYDIEKLLEGRVEKYKLAPAMGGVCNFIDNSKFSDRFSFIENYNSIAVVPFPHLNLINCVGMGQKHEYLIWREKNGFFTALDKSGQLLTWSLITGKLLYTEVQDDDAAQEEMQNYDVFRSDLTDITYVQSFYNMKDYSINLLKSQKKITANDMSIVGNQINHKKLKQKVSNQDKKNKHGMVNIDQNVKRLEENLFMPHPVIPIEILNSQQESDLYHFKVMELSTHEDTKGFSNCRLRFHFLFDMIRRKERSHLKNFDWDVNSNPVQRLYLSENTFYMMEVTNDFIANVYYRVNVSEDLTTIKPQDDDSPEPDKGTKRGLISKSQSKKEQQAMMVAKDKQMQEYWDDDNGQLVKWKIAFRIKRYPTKMLKHTSVPYLFSPNFVYMFDFSHRTHSFSIRECRNLHIYMEIPKDLIDTTWNKMEGEPALKLILSRIKWKSDRIIHIVNASNLDCYFELCSTDESDNDPTKRYLKLLSAVKIDNEFENMKKMDSPHMMDHPVCLQSRDVLERLIRTNQHYKVKLCHALSGTHLSSRGGDILTNLNKIDYLQNWDDKLSSFDVELSFTWLDWRIAEIIINDDDFNIGNLSQEQAVQLCFNIFPQGRGILHQMALGGQNEQQGVTQQGDQIQMYHQCKELFNVANNQLQFWLTGQDADQATSYEIPILPDMYGITPLDICLGISKHREADKEIFRKDQSAENEIFASENAAMAEVIFDNLKNYGFMQSSTLINEALIEAVKRSLPGIGEYLDSRMQKVDHCFTSNTQRAIKSSSMVKLADVDEIGMIGADIWMRESEMKDMLFEAKGALQPMGMSYVDIPNIFHHTAEGMDFMDALKVTEDIDIFGLKSIQILIEAHQKYWLKRHLYAIGLPQFLQLCVYFYWSNIVLVNIEVTDDLQGIKVSDNFKDQNDNCAILLNVLSAYLIIIELPIMWNQKLNYLKNVMSWVNWTIFILIFKNSTNVQVGQQTFWTIQTYLSLLIWFRLLLYLRVLTLFNHLVRMIVQSLVDMGVFAVILIIGIFAFADAFQSIDYILQIRGEEGFEPREIPENANIYEKYGQGYVLAWQKAFMYAMGEFDGNMDYFRESDWLVFFLSCIFNIILLLNLLIAILSKTFDDITEKQVETGYREMVYHICTMQDTLFGWFKAPANPNQLLFVAKVISSEEIEDEDVADQIEELSAKLDNTKEELQDYIENKLELLANAILDKMPENENSVKNSQTSVTVLSKMQEQQKKKKKQQEMHKKMQVRLNSVEEGGYEDQLDLVFQSVSKNIQRAKKGKKKSAFQQK